MLTVEIPYQNPKLFQIWVRSNANQSKPIRKKVSNLFVENSLKTNPRLKTVFGLIRIALDTDFGLVLNEVLSETFIRGNTYHFNNFQSYRHRFTAPFRGKIGKILSSRFVLVSHLINFPYFYKKFLFFRVS